jgi:hypothetical protein
MTNDELIEKFHSNGLSNEEVALFKDKYENDVDFKMESDRFTKLYIALNAIGKKQSESAAISSGKQFKKSGQNNQLKVVFRAAAIFIPIIILANIGYYSFSKKSNDTLYKKFFTVKNEQAISLQNNNCYQYEYYLKAINLSIVEVLDEIGESKDLYTFGTFCMEQNKFSEAILIFRRLIIMNEFKEDSEWFLGLCYLKTGDPNAFETFSKIASNNAHKYHSEAQKVVREIN